MNLSSYLHKRPNSQYWQLRWMVPKASRQHLVKREFTKSLGVTDRKEAERLAYLQISEWQEIVKEVEKRICSIRERDIEAISISTNLAQEVYEEAFKISYGTLNLLLPNLAKAEQETFRGIFELIEKNVRRDKQRVLAGDFDDIPHWAVLLMKQEGLDTQPESQAMINVGRAIMRASIDARSKIIMKIDGKEHSAVPSDFQKRLADAKGRQASPGENILELFDRYAAQRLKEKRKRADTVTQDRKVIERFAEFVGHDRSLRSITSIDVRDWRNALASLPANYRKMSAYSGMTMQEACEEAKGLKASGLSPTTVNKYLSTLSPLFSWATTESYAASNPCDGLFLDIKKGKNPRPPFSTDQLNIMLGSPLFTGFLKDGKEHLTGNVRAEDWRYWIPLICLFTGARIGEIAQLRVDDVKLESDVWFFHIRDNEETGQKTKSGQSRSAPIHSILRGIGFLDFHARQVKKSEKHGNRQLFPELVPNTRGQIGAVPSRFWRDYLTAIKLKDGRDGFGSHSFRHTMADQLRQADYLDDEIEVALGHNQKTVTSGYGKLKQGTVKRLNTMFEAARFEGVRFNHPRP